MENDKLVRHGVFAEWLKNRADDLASRAQKPVPGAPGCYTVDDGLSCAAAVMYDAYRMYQLQPAVDAVEEKQGFWKAAGTGHPKPGNQRYRKQDQWTVYKCSNCGASNGRNHSDPYCRHCGARRLTEGR